jgi:amino acid transporter
MTARRHHDDPARTLGTFGGVFTPSILTILGIILFLRLGWIVGQGGLARALVMIGLAHTVSILTSLSLAAIATNRRVRGGGDYFLVSRSLGLEYGGALGLVLFATQSISIAFYCFGFGEAAAPLLAQLGYVVPVKMAGTAAAAGLGLLAWLGADLATRFQYGVLAAIVAALVSFFVGAGGDFDGTQLVAGWSAPDQTPSFWVLFAVFFPAVTGFTQGVSLSGNLKDPARSLPFGTLAATGLSVVVYTVAAVAFAGAAPLAALRADTAILGKLSAVPVLFHVGVMAATLSSALASFLGAPRILQAMARDGVLPPLEPFAHGSGPTENPRRAVVLAGVIAFTVLALGELNNVARLITMFFLISYGLLNAATYVEARGASPAFRPRFRFFHARLSGVGAAVCIGLMFALDVWAAVVSIAVMAALHQYLRRVSVPATWVDSRRAYEFRRLKEAIAEIDRHPETEWTWQPHILTLASDPENNDLVLRLATSVTGGSGMVTAVGLVEGEGDLESTQGARRAAEEELRDLLRSQHLDAYALVVAAPDFRDAVATLVQAWGIGPVRANTVMVDWYERLPEDSRGRDPLWYGRELLGMLRLGCHVISVNVHGKEWRRVQELASDERRIDVWWWESPSSRLALLLAYLVTRNDDWCDSTVRVLVPCEAEQEKRSARAADALLHEARIDARIETVVDPTTEKLQQLSAESSVVFMPLHIDGMRVVDPLGGELEKIIGELPTTLLVGASGDVSLREPEHEKRPGGKDDESRKAGEAEKPGADDTDETTDEADAEEADH